MCPCCYSRTLAGRNHYEICAVCFWEDDGQDNADADEVRGGPNGDLSLAHARTNYRAYGASTFRDSAHIRLPRHDELTPRSPPFGKPNAEKARTFLSQWQNDHNGTPPIFAYLLAAYKSRWMRIHSLPDAKRYPDTDAEWKILLHRHNTLIDHLIPQGTLIQIVINWMEPECHLFQSYDPAPLGIIQEAPEEAAYESYLLETTWENDPRNPILMMIAGEQLSGVTIITPDVLIHPYDGGVDVIAKDSHTCWELKRTFKDWLSSRPDGL